MSAQEPGLDLHVWTSRFESLEDDLRDDPAARCPTSGSSSRRCSRRAATTCPTRWALAGDDPEVIATFSSAREIALRAEGDGADPGDVGEAIQGFTAMYEYLTAERPGP